MSAEPQQGRQTLANTVSAPGPETVRKLLALLSSGAPAVDEDPAPDSKTA